MAMVPHERSLVERLQNRPFALLGVNADPSRDALRQTQEKHQITWRSWWDGSRRIATKYHVSRYPALFLVNHDGIIRRSYLGRPPDAQIEQDVMQVVAEAEQAAAGQHADNRRADDADIR
jgi:hypothetical protein